MPTFSQIAAPTTSTSTSTRDATYDPAGHRCSSLSPLVGPHPALLAGCSRAVHRLCRRPAGAAPAHLWRHRPGEQAVAVPGRRGARACRPRLRHLLRAPAPRPWAPDDEHRLLTDALEQVELADRLGIDYLWEGEHHLL